MSKSGDNNQSDRDARIAAILSSVPRHLISAKVDKSSPEVPEESPGNLTIPESPFNKKKNARWSHIWFPENGYEVEVEGRPRWVCRRCTGPHPANFATTSTKNQIAHLRAAHNIGPDGPITTTPEPSREEPTRHQSMVRQQTIEEAFKPETPQLEFDPAMFQLLFTNWVITEGIDPRVCEDQSFRNILRYLAACTPNYTAIHDSLPNGNAMRKELVSFYEEMKVQVKNKLRTAESKIHFSFDTWKGPDRQTYQAIVAHWLDPQGRLHATLLSLQLLRGPSTRRSQADMFLYCLEEYDIRHLVGKFTVPKASKNDTALEEISKRLRDAGYPSFDPVADRVHCFRQALNDAVKSLLWGADFEAFEREVIQTFERQLNGQYDEDGPEGLAELLRWRNKGPLGKLHNVLAYIYNSPLRRDRFLELVKEIDPAEETTQIDIGNITPWFNDYEGIQQAFRLREAITEFVRSSIVSNQDGEKDDSDSALQHDELTPEDWEVLRCIKDILEPFKNWTERLTAQYGNGCVADILPVMDELLFGLEKAKVFYKGEGRSDQLMTMINNACDVLDRYCGLTDLCPAYIVAVALDPHMKLAYFREEWKDTPEWIEKAQQTLEQIWTTSYRGSHGGATVAPEEREPEPEQGFQPLSRWARKRRQLFAAENADVMEVFQQQPPVAGIMNDVLGYWNSKRFESPRWNDLARMALEYLSIPAMLTETQNVFAGAKITIEEHGCSVDEEALNILECLRSWQRDGLISDVHPKSRELNETLSELGKAELAKNK